MLTIKIDVTDRMVKLGDDFRNTKRDKIMHSYRLRRWILQKLPALRNYYYILRRPIKPLLHVIYAGNSRYCPVCNSHVRKFKSFSSRKNSEAVMCPICMSVERHRLACFFFEKKTNLFEQAPKKMLHIAPEECLRTRFNAIRGMDYLSADIEAADAMIKMDITDINIPENSFDVVMCSHVLEHVPDDRKALQEFFRVLRSGGWLVVIVPDFAEKSIEDPTVTSPEERERVFGQRDHVRIYGRDFIERLYEAGFEAEVFSINNIDPTIDSFRVGIPASERLYYCIKP